MITKLVERVSGLVGDAVRHAPLEVALSALMTVWFWVAVSADSGDVWESWRRYGAAALFALPLLMTLTTLRLRDALQPLARWGAAAAVLAGSVGIAQLFDFTREAALWRMAWLLALSWGVLAGAAAVAVMVRRAGTHGAAVGAAGGDAAVTSDAATRDPGDAASSLITHRWWLGLYATLQVHLAYCGALFLGLAAAIAATDALFSLHLSGKVYAHLAGGTFFLLFPSLVVGGLPRLIAALDEAEGPAERPRVRAVRYLLAPLMVVYLTIVYAYLLRVALTGHWPSNLLSPMALGAAAFGLFAHVVLADVLDRAEHQAMALTVRVGTALAVVPLGFGVAALGMRVAQYGMTPFRYVRGAMLVLAFVVAVLCAVAWLRRRPVPLVGGLVVAVVVALVGLAGPLSLVGTSVRSQLARAAVVAQEQGLHDGQRWLTVDERVVPEGSRDEHPSLGAYDLRSPLMVVVDLVGPEATARHLGMSAEEFDELSRLVGLWWRGRDYHQEYAPECERRSWYRDGTATIFPAMPAGAVADIAMTVWRGQAETTLSDGETQVSVTFEPDTGTVTFRGWGPEARSFELADVVVRLNATDAARAGGDEAREEVPYGYRTLPEGLLVIEGDGVTAALRYIEIGFDDEPGGAAPGDGCGEARPVSFGAMIVLHEASADAIPVGDDVAPAETPSDDDGEDDPGE